MKSRIAKVTAASALTVGIVGLGAGIASAQPAQQPAQQQQQQQHNDQQPQNDQNRQDQNRRDQDRHDQAQQPAGHGFWFFGTWIPLP
ncbi:hypothetical protein [Nocardia nova]|uniref:hypothetical protein n=1 Tax=Nocardia nova TaxID=37330 RepID=UPI0033FBF38C